MFKTIRKNYDMAMADAAQHRRNRRAASTRLALGEDSIDRVTPVQRDDGSIVIDWSVRLPDGRLVAKRSQARTVDEVRRRAKAKASDLVQAKDQSTWKLTDSLDAYLDTVSWPKIEDADLRPSSRTRYKSILRLLQGRAWDPDRKTYAACRDHPHNASLSSHTIASAVRFRTHEQALQEIARTHGPESAHQARSVLSKYVIQQLIRDGLITGNPLFGVDIDLRGEHRGNGAKRASGRALRRDEYLRVLDYLLSIDPADGANTPRRGRWIVADAVAKRANAIDLTLIQATSGLRMTEAATRTWHDVDGDVSGRVFITVPDAVSKTHRGRRVPILDPRVADRLMARRATAQSPSEYVIGAPTAKTKMWEQRNRDRIVAALYVELADVLDIEMLRSARSHVWRATLNSLLLSLPEAQRTAFFGHGPAANRQHYTDVTDVTPLITAAERLRAGVECLTVD